ncbi:hypothetical protein BJX70DRAFT_396494 [Aspergillus crustosus]
MSFFGLGRLVYVIILITNSIAILSEDRFLARIGWGRTQADPAFGAAYDSTSVKAKTINLIATPRTSSNSEDEGGAVVSLDIAEDTHANDSSLELTVPLIVINTIIIVYEFILG